MLIHGGGHSSKCWQPLLPHLDAPGIAVDLPGRGRRPSALDDVRLADFVEALVEEINALGTRDVILVGHSMAGISISGVLERSRKSIRHVVLISCAIPPDGGTLLDLFPVEVREAAASASPSPSGIVKTENEIRASQTYDMNDEQARFVVDAVVPEAFWPMREPVSLAGFRKRIPCTWVKLLGDRTFSTDLQDEMAKRAGCNATRVVDSGHMVMVSHPLDLAVVLNEIHSMAVTI